MKLRYPNILNLDMEEHSEQAHHNLVDTLVLTSEICGHTLSYAAANMLAQDLAQFDETAVLSALARCRLTVQGHLKVADIIRHLEDGRPSIDEAWAMLPLDERMSVVWTEEMAYAWGTVLPLLDAGDTGNARKLFNQDYAKAVFEARINRVPVRWTPSLGSDVKHRADVLLEAVKRGRLSMKQVEQLLPPEKLENATEPVASAVERRNLH